MTRSVLIVGSGAAATLLARAFTLSGVPVLAMWGRDAARTTSAASASGVMPRWGPLDGEPPYELGQAEVVVCAVKDDAIAEVAARLGPRLRPHHVLLHCSGAMPAHAALGAAAGSGAALGTFHPLLAISDPRGQAADLSGITITVEGDPRAVLASKELVSALGASLLELAAHALPLYHAAAVLAANALVTLFDAATAALRATGVPSADAAHALAPLAIGAITAAAERGAAAALTGPIARGDAHTVSGHLAALASGAPDLLPLYVAVGERTLELARRRGVPAGRAPAATAGWVRIEDLLREARKRQP